MLQKQAQQTQQIQQAQQICTDSNERSSSTWQNPRAPIIMHPPKPAQTQISSRSHARRRHCPQSPGGIVITATALMDGLKAEDIAGAGFHSEIRHPDALSASDRRVAAKLNADHFAVAVKSIFGLEIDPILDVDFGEKKGYESFATAATSRRSSARSCMTPTRSWAQILWIAEETMARVMAGMAPDTEELVCESHRTMTLGSRMLSTARPASSFARIA